MKRLYAFAIVVLLVYITGLGRAVYRNVKERLLDTKVQGHQAAFHTGGSSHLGWHAGYWHSPGSGSRQVRRWPPAHATSSPFLDSMQY